MLPEGGSCNGERSYVRGRFFSFAACASSGKRGLSSAIMCVPALATNKAVFPFFFCQVLKALFRSEAAREKFGDGIKKGIFRKEALQGKSVPLDG